MTRETALKFLRGIERRDPGKDECLGEARNLTSETGRKHVVRVDRGRYFVCPLYAPGAEGVRYDPGFEGIGSLVKESI